MITITGARRTVLEAAARHPDRIAAPPRSLPPAPRAAVAKAPREAGLLGEADGAEVRFACPVFADRAQRLDDRWVRRRDHPALTALPPPAAQSRDTGGNAGC
jgi:hypothetical protein